MIIFFCILTNYVQNVVPTLQKYLDGFKVYSLIKCGFLFSFSQGPIISNYLLYTIYYLDPIQNTCNVIKLT